MLSDYVLKQIVALAKSIKKRKPNSNIAKYINVAELTPEILNDVIAKIEISHVSRNSKPSNVIHIDWKPV